LTPHDLDSSLCDTGLKIRIRQRLFGKPQLLALLHRHTLLIHKVLTRGLREPRLPATRGRGGACPLPGGGKPQYCSVKRFCVGEGLVPSRGGGRRSPLGDIAAGESFGLKSAG